MWCARDKTDRNEVKAAKTAKISSVHVVQRFIAVKESIENVSGSGKGV